THETKFPAGIPVKFFLAQETLDVVPDWKKLHDGQVSEPTESTTTVLPGGHLLYRTQSQVITDGLRLLVTL
ncbi:hypothetical protein B7Z28_01270, partial [Candidatus Saccharibacteria bacterium 32-45-3]